MHWSQNRHPSFVWRRHDSLSLGPGRRGRDIDRVARAGVGPRTDRLVRGLRGSGADLARRRRRCPLPRPATRAFAGRSPHRARLRTVEPDGRSRRLCPFQPRRRPPAGHRRLDAHRLDQVGSAGHAVAGPGGSSSHRGPANRPAALDARRRVELYRRWTLAAVAHRRHPADVGPADPRPAHRVGAQGRRARSLCRQRGLERLRRSGHDERVDRRPGHRRLRGGRGRRGRRCRHARCDPPGRRQPADRSGVCPQSGGRRPAASGSGGTGRLGADGPGASDLSPRHLAPGRAAGTLEADGIQRGVAAAAGIAGDASGGRNAGAVAGLSAAARDFVVLARRTDRRAGRDRTRVRPRVGVGPWLGPEPAAARGDGPSGRAGAAGRSRASATADLLGRERLAGVQPPGRSVADRPPAAGHEPGDGRLRHLDSPSAVAGAAGHQGLDDRADAALGGPAATTRHAVARRRAAAGGRFRADSPDGLHGGCRGKPRAVVPLRFAADGRRCANPAAGDGAGDVESRTAMDRALGGCRQRGRHGRRHAAGVARHRLAHRSCPAPVAGLARPGGPVRAGTLDRGQHLAGRARRARIEQRLRE